MKFKDSFRMEKVYFQKLKSDIDIAKSYIAAGAVDQARAVLDSIVDVDGAVLLLYRNLGELWADLQAHIEELKKALENFDEKTDRYHDELNKKIDEINNYIMLLIRELFEKKQDKETPPAQYTVQDFSYDLSTDITSEDHENILYNNNYGFYIRNVRFNAPEHIRDTPAAITLKEYAIGTDALADYLQPIKAFMNINKIKGIEIFSRTSLVVVGAAYLMYEATCNATIYNRPAVGNQNTGSDSGGIWLHTEPHKETFIDCSKFAGTKYYIFKRYSINLIPEEDSTQTVNMKTLADIYLFDIPRMLQVNWAEHREIVS